ncbi:FAD/NAD-P-binding domain-containing protein [Amylostereum chailletii]|nr:FAD/NAD-P-binding domain-containing protein [Amylostereum chailletii]
MAQRRTDPRLSSIAIIGAGIAGLVTAHTLLQDGFVDVRVLTRDAFVGGVWGKDRVYPGLYINNVHGEYRLSSMEMDPPITAGVVGGRLTGEDLRRYTEAFAAKFLEGKIQFDTEVRNVRRGTSRPTEGWEVAVENRRTGKREVHRYARVVLCTGGCSTPLVPESLSPHAAAAAGFKGPVFHSMDFGLKMDELLAAARRPIGEDPSSDPSGVVVVGGGKSAQDISAYLANEGRKVSVVFDRTDAFTAGSRPLPDFIRKSRFLSLFSPHIHLRTVLERFLHTTTLGKKIVDWFWHGLADSSLHPAGVPADSPIRRTFSPFWSVRINDEGVPRANGFHALANAGKIALVAPARVAGFGEDGRSVVLEDGRTLRADAVVLATGYRSSWPQMFDGQTLEDLALRRHAPAETTAPPHWGYTTLSDPPPQPTHSQAQQWSTSIYRGLVPAPNILRRDLAVNGAVISPNNGYTVEVAAHWISSYFLGDAMRLPTSPEEALQETARNAAWLKVRYPDTAVAMNESHTNSAAFWTWPQHVDDLLEDMGLPVMRSGGNWLTWPFKVVDLEEIRELKGERDARRARRA